jgi:threonylcarbamoyladenosine tRNA methylthiotransferase MtaB
VSSVAFKTLGCRLNQAETARIRATFEAGSFTIVPFGESADVCVIHTCAVTAAAETECIRLARGIKRRSPDTCVILAGCAAVVSGPRILSQSGADMLAGHDEKYRLPELIAASFSIHNSPLTIHADPLPRFETTRAWVKAQDGCSFACAYCIVPLARGPSRSRPRGEVVDEVKGLADQGYREVVLTGANLGCYREETARLTDLVADVERVQGIRRIRLSSIEMSTTEREVIDYMAGSEKLAHFLHLPLQTGDDGLLRAMGRRYTARDYRQLIDYILERMPLAGIGTDLIAGLPGEDESAFSHTLELVRAIPFGNLQVFPDSIRPRTRAASMSGHVARDVARRRAETLTALGRKKQAAFASRFVGRKVEVLIENGVDSEGRAAGWTREYVRARVKRPDINANDVLTLIPSRCDDGVIS